MFPATGLPGAKAHVHARGPHLELGGGRRQLAPLLGGLPARGGLRVLRAADLRLPLPQQRGERRLGVAGLRQQPSQLQDAVLQLLQPDAPATPRDTALARARRAL